MAGRFRRALLVAILAAKASAHNNCAWWFEDTRHGFSYRNVTAFGAIGDGVADDTHAFQLAIDFNRGGDNGSNADKSAAFVYVPPGRYRLTDTIVLWKWTSLIGNPKCPPTLFLSNATAAFNGSEGLRPFIVTNDGFNSTTSDHAWWLEEADVGGATNDNFFTQVRYFTIEIGAGNPGATAVLWQVAQQTALRNVTILAGDAAVGLDMASTEYVHWNGRGGVPASYNLGGGGVVTDVTVTGGRAGIRTAASQFTLTDITVSGSEVCVQMWQLTWAISWLRLRASDCGIGALVQNGTGTAAFLDSSFSRIAGGVAFHTDGASPLYLQNLATDASISWVVDFVLAANASAPVASWAQGAVFIDGVAAPGLRGPLRLPTEADAASQGVPLVCGATGGALCGGSAERPATGIPHRPRPMFDDDLGVLNAQDAGAKGDGKTDDTAALQAAFLASRTVFIPFGLYVVSDTLTLRPDSRIVGEGLSVLWLAENAPGFSGPGLKTLLRVPENATSEVWLADITLWSTYCNATGARMLEWGAGPASGIWDVNMLLAMPVGLKLAVSGTGGAGAGYLSNTWFPATPNYVAAGRTVDAALRAIGPASAPSSSAAPLLHGGAGEPACSPNMPTGLNVTSRGPLFWVGTDMEHSTAVEYGFQPGAQNHVLVTAQTEEATAGLVLNGTLNVVVFNALLAYWEFAVPSPAEAVALRPGAPSPGPATDLAYRLYGLFASGGKNLLDDSRYSVPATSPAAMSGAVALLNTRARGPL